MDQPSAPAPKRKAAVVDTESEADIRPSTKKPKPNQTYVEDGHDSSSVLESESDDDEDDMSFSNDSEDEDLGFGFMDEDEEDEDEDEDDEEDMKQDVEESQHVVPGHPDKIFQLKIFTTKPVEELFIFGGDGERKKWLLDYHAQIKYDGKVIGHTHARRIYREFVRANFWQEMDGVSQDMSNLAYRIFNRYGCLLEELKSHPVRKGSGVWGNELDFGPILHFENVHIYREAAEFRRLGLGTTMVKAIIQKVQKKLEDNKSDKDLTQEQTESKEMFEGLFGVPDPKFSKLHCLTLPGWLTRDLEPEIKDKNPSQQREICVKAAETAEAFFKSLGFRRVGASSCLAFSLDPQHPSHLIAPVDDYEPSEDTFVEEFTDAERAEIKAAFKKHEKEEEIFAKKLATILPLHHAAIIQADIDCVDTFSTHLAKNGVNSTDWKAVQKGGNNLLHVVASKHKPLTTTWLMENIADSAGLSTARNVKGYTPFENLNSELDVKRTRAYRGMRLCDVSDQFIGHPEEAVQCLAALSKLPTINSTLPSVTVKRMVDHRSRLKFGCTCGDCIEGFISPRMKAALVYQAEKTQELTSEWVEDADMWWFAMKDHIEHVPEPIKQNFETNKSLRQGFVNTFNLVASCLKRNIAPTRTNLIAKFEELSEWPPVTRNYLQVKGTLDGKFEAVLLDIFKSAEDHGEMTCGSSPYFRAMCGALDVDTVKACRNDDEFCMVMVALGLPNPNPTTPFDYVLENQAMMGQVDFS
ncbi:hypothetical protein HYFRA_00008161 [Hymenoscyphus fraxineus]|uniref:Uncharacterized protein n=1 Tax=Hymenoscyphus fraxineus TaxID=746836 RepID=A0A9N9Q063_9HELO|nr:hypothetical protein HYFRA_00008161 [Hymenoscyphus fraxineus]